MLTPCSPAIRFATVDLPDPGIPLMIKQNLKLCSVSSMITFS